MQDYMEMRLTGVHTASVASKFNFKQKCVTLACCVTAVFFLPYLHIGIFYSIWIPDKPTVNKAKCVCDCFDTVFRGRYEWPPSAYKHVYFNATSNTLKIWLLVILGVLGLHESVRHLVPLGLNKKMRWPMLVVFLSSLYPHYYGWWGLFNYLNEDFYPQWHHQIFFTCSEIISTVMVLHLCNLDNPVLPWKLLVIINVNLIHIIIGCLDQFIDNIVYHRAKDFEAVRDLGLLMPDIFHVLLPFFELQNLAERQRVSLFRLFYKEELYLSVVLILLCSLLGKNL